MRRHPVVGGSVAAAGALVNVEGVLGPPSATFAEVAWVDAELMREIDRTAVEEVGLALLQMMENAGRSLAGLVTGYFSPTSVTVLAGSGGNGGGGLAAARHLRNAGIDVSVFLTVAEERLSAAAMQQLQIIEHSDIAVARNPDLDADVIVDAMVGYGLSGALRGTTAEVVVLAGASPAAVMSLDVPTGLDATTGESTGVQMFADVTMTLCLPKTGLRNGVGVGDLYLADISVPAEVTTAVAGGPAPPFERGPVLHLVPS